MVLVTHDSMVARRAQRIGMMKNGRLTFKRPARRKATRLASPADPPRPADFQPADFQPSDLPSADSFPADPADSISFPTSPAPP